MKVKKVDDLSVPLWAKCFQKISKEISAAGDERHRRSPYASDRTSEPFPTYIFGGFRHYSTLTSEYIGPFQT